MSPRSEELMAEAWEALRAARILVEAGSFARSVSDSYYAMLYAARAALSEVDRYAKTHRGIWDLFHLEFVEHERFDPALAAAARGTQASREGVDYDALGVDEVEARRLADLAGHFVAAVEAMVTQRR